MTVFTAVMTIEQAIIATLNADAQFIAAMGGAGRVYSSLVPEETPRPYLLLGQTSEAGAPVIQRASAGYYNGKVISIFSEEVGKAKCCVIYGHCRRLLHQQKLPLGEGRMIRGALRLVSMYPDPVTGEELASLFYDVHTRN